MARLGIGGSAPLWQLTVRTSLAGEGSVVQLLESIYRQPACVCWDPHRGVNSVSVYLEAAPAADPRAWNALCQQLRSLRPSGVARVTRPSVRRVPPQDWTESWKRHFPPLLVGNLWVSPTWCRRRPPKGVRCMTLDPGLSFGTGQHPTTRFCLEQVVALRRTGVAQSLLDVGTGSGILAIAAAHLGYAPVVAVDIDPSSLRIARANARLNGVDRAIAFERKDVTRSSTPRVRATIICANLTADLLIQNCARLCRMLEPGGTLVLAGMLIGEAAAVASAYAAHGLLPRRRQDKGEWGSRSLCKPDAPVPRVPSRRRRNRAG